MLLTFICLPCNVNTNFVYWIKTHKAVWLITSNYIGRSNEPENDTNESKSDTIQWVLCVFIEREKKIEYVEWSTEEKNFFADLQTNLNLFGYVNHNSCCYFYRWGCQYSSFQVYSITLLFCLLSSSVVSLLFCLLKEI